MRSYILPALLLTVVCVEFGFGQAETDLRIPTASQAAVTIGPPGCPVVLVENDAWHLKQGRIVRTLEGQYESHALRCLSANGQYFAAADKSPNQRDTAVHVWNVVTQKQVLTIPGDPEHFVDILRFADSKTLVLGGRLTSKLSIWDIESGETEKTVELPVRRIDPSNFAISPDGKYAALPGDETIIVCRLSTGKQVTALVPPGASGGPRVAKLPSPARNPAAYQAALKARLEAKFTMAWMRGLTFSPDGKEIAAFSTHPHAHLLCWSSQGKLTLDEPLSSAKLSLGNSQLVWLPDASGWLINGNLFDRKSKQLVLNVRFPFGQDPLILAIDRGHLLGQFGNGALETLVVPWDDLDKSLDAMKQKAPAYLSPGQPVSVRIELANVRGDAAETEQLLRDAVAKRLERNNIPIADGQPTTLVLKLAESAGDTLPIFERQSRFDFRGKDTGRTATEAGGDLVIELVAEGEASPLWRDSMKGSSSRSFKEEINDQTVRKSMLENLSRRLNDLPLPYFFPKSSDLLALPAIVE